MSGLWNIVPGSSKFDPGGYYLILQVRDATGAVVYDTASDGQGFGVFGQ